MSQFVLNWQESPTILEPWIRQIVRDELARLIGTLTKPEPSETEQGRPQTSVPSETKRELRRAELNMFFAQFQTDVTGYRFNREEANDR